MGIHFFLLYYLGAINYQTNIVLLILTSCLISHQRTYCRCASTTSPGSCFAIKNKIVDNGTVELKPAHLDPTNIVMRNQIQRWLTLYGNL